jgi:uncharacterized glyoxalase superfamily protein PhnB
MAAARHALQPIPEGYHAVTPCVVSRNTAQLIQFVKEAFGAEELSRLVDEKGNVTHAEVRIDDSVVMMFDGKESWQETPAFLRLYVRHADAMFQQALDAGAEAVTEMTDLPWGDRVGRVRDPLGNVWWIMTRLEEVPPSERVRRSRQPEYVRALHYVQSAELAPLQS